MPECSFQAAILDVVMTLAGRRGCKCLVLQKFGLDLALFLAGGGRTYVRFLEAKVYVACIFSPRPLTLGVSWPQAASHLAI
jgi:hypothetical protein